MLEYNQDLSVRSKNTKEKFCGLVKSISKNADELGFSSQEDVDEYFELQKNFSLTIIWKLKNHALKPTKINLKTYPKLPSLVSFEL